jgi:hypothetical protein
MMVITGSSIPCTRRTTHAVLVEALNRHRGNVQKVQVEHVTVHAGGQAIVGTVEAQGIAKPIKTEERRSWTCSEPQGAEQKRNPAGSRANRQQWQTAGATCTAECRRGPKRVTRTLANTVFIPLRQLRTGRRFRLCCGLRKSLRSRNGNDERAQGLVGGACERNTIPIAPTKDWCLENHRGAGELPIISQHNPAP